VKGQKSYGIYFPAPIKTLCVLDVNRQKRFERLLVGLGNGEVRVYHENVCVLTLATGQNDPPTGLLFARLGREENALAIVTKNGSVTVKIMPRRADLSAGSAGNGNNDASNGPEDHSIPLAVPKKTKVYVENAARERLVGKEMHQTFQKDLQRYVLRVSQIIDDCLMPCMECSHASLTTTISAPENKTVCALYENRPTRDSILTLSWQNSPGCASTRRARGSRRFGMAASAGGEAVAWVTIPLGFP
jgi:hypothetical protein|tara:strand:- start:1358 stop:2095 length:738 start_codon:yes stop_codon:yes gene_type:complete